MSGLRRLGGTAVSVSELGFGAAGLGNLYREASDAETEESLETAWACGVRYFDTAPHYGVGLSERRLGAWLSGRKRDEYTVSTKVGRLLVPNEDPDPGRDPHFVVPATHRRVWDFSRDGILRSLDESLTRLGIDRIDVALLHDPDDHGEPALTEALPALAELRDQGVIGAIGAGMNQSAMLTRFIEEADIDVVMVAGRFTLLEQGALADLLPAAHAHGVSVLAAGVFNSGLLSKPEPAADAHYDYAAAPAELIERARRIAAVCRRHGTDLPTAAVRFPFTHPAVASVVLGMRGDGQVRANAAYVAAEVPGDLWRDLAAEGLLDPALLEVREASCA